MSQPTWDPDTRRWLLDGADATGSRRNRRRSVDVIDRPDAVEEPGEPGVGGRAGSTLGAQLTRVGFGARDRLDSDRDRAPDQGSDRRGDGGWSLLDPLRPDPLAGDRAPARDRDRDLRDADAVGHRTDTPPSYRPGEFDRFWRNGLSGSDPVPEDPSGRRPRPAPGRGPADHDDRERLDEGLRPGGDRTAAGRYETARELARRYDEGRYDDGRSDEGRYDGGRSDGGRAGGLRGGGVDADHHDTARNGADRYGRDGADRYGTAYDGTVRDDAGRHDAPRDGAGRYGGTRGAGDRHGSDRDGADRYDVDGYASSRRFGDRDDADRYVGNRYDDERVRYDADRDDRPQYGPDGDGTARRTDDRRDGSGRYGVDRDEDRRDADRYASDPYVRNGADPDRHDRYDADPDRPAPYGRNGSDTGTGRYGTVLDADRYDVDRYDADRYDADRYGRNGSRPETGRHDVGRYEVDHGHDHDHADPRASDRYGRDGSRRDAGRYGTDHDADRYDAATPPEGTVARRAVAPRPGPGHRPGTDDHEGPARGRRAAVAYAEPGPEQFDDEGYNLDGRGPDGYGRDGVDPYGFDREGFDSDGFDREGFDRDGFDRDGFDPEGYDRDGYHADAYTYDETYDPAPTTEDGRHGRPDTDLRDGDGYGYATGYGPEGYRPGRRRAHTDDDIDEQYPDGDPDEPGLQGTLVGGEVPAVAEAPAEGGTRAERRARRAKRRRWPWVVGAAAVTGAVAVPVGMTLLGSNGEEQVDPPLLANATGTSGTAAGATQSADGAAPAAAAAPATGQITYEVTGSGSARAITFGRGTAVAQTSGATLPWTLDSPAAEGESDYTLTAVSDGGGDIACRILFGGAVIAENKADGDYAAVSCNGRR